MGINKVSGVNGYIPPQRIAKNDVKTEQAATVAAQDAFIRSSQTEGPNYVRYPYGAPELTMAVLATSAMKVPKDPEIPVEKAEDPDSWIVVGKAEGAAASHNNETHHYNQQESKNLEAENLEFSDEIEEE